MTMSKTSICRSCGREIHFIDYQTGRLKGMKWVSYDSNPFNGGQCSHTPWMKGSEVITKESDPRNPIFSPDFVNPPWDGSRLEADLSRAEAEAKKARSAASWAQSDYDSVGGAALKAELDSALRVAEEAERKVEQARAALGWS